jgi:aminotransferase
LAYNGAKVPNLISDERLRRNRISCFSFSKEYAMTGYRVGYVFAEEGMIRQMLKVHDSFIVSAPRPSQVAALAALKGDQACVAELRQTLQDRRDRLCTHLDRMKKWFSYVKPAGAYYCFPKFLPFVDAQKQGKIGDTVQLAIDILYGAKVAVVPGIAFGPDGKNHLRFCFGCTLPEIDEGMARLEAWLKKHYS